MSETTKTPKITKKDNFLAILDILDAARNGGVNLKPGDVTYDSLTDFINHEIELIDNKAAAAAKRAAAKKAEGDALRDTIYNILSTDEDKTVDAIQAELNDPDVSNQMITSRMSKLIASGMVEKTQVSAGNVNGKTRKLTAYRKIG